MAATDQILHIIAEQAGIESGELEDDCEFAHLGVDDLLVTPILSQVQEELHVTLPTTIFHDYPSVADFKAYLNSSDAPYNGTESGGIPHPSAHPVPNPLSVVLQGSPETCKTTIFLIPDGSGTAMAFARFPRIDVEICLVAMNSPYLRSPASEAFSIESISGLWATEIQSRQRHGPYVVGGWSAGGYCSYEVAKHLMHRGERVEKLVLIDTPCLLLHESLPMEVVNWLTTSNVMGNWGYGAPPEWLVKHATLLVQAVQQYKPTAMHGPDIPAVFIIWAEDSVLEAGDHRLTELDMNVSVTRILIQRPDIDGADGWDKWFPKAQVEVAKTRGNHFTMVYPPHVRVSSKSILRGAAANR